MSKERERAGAEVVKPHTCRRFKQTGSMRLMAAELTVTVNGKQTSQSMSADTVFLKCTSCQQIQQVDRQRVVNKGSYLALKAEVR